MTDTKFATSATYEASYQNKEIAILGMFGLALAMVAVIAFAIVFIEDGNEALPVMLSAIGGLVVGVIVLFLMIVRVHRWTIEPNGLRIEEWAKVMGPRRSVFVAFADIAALRNLESNFDDVIELLTRDGKLYRLMRQRSPLVKSVVLEAQPALQPFGAALSAAIAVSGAKPVPLTEGLSFWNRASGIALILVLLVISIALAMMTLWALFDGGLEYRTRLGEVVFMFLALPFGCVYLLRKALKRRRRVLSGQGVASLK